MNTASPAEWLQLLVAGYDAEAARCRDPHASQYHSPHGTCRGGLSTECTDRPSQAKESE